MEILLIIMLVPLALALGFGLLRLMVEPAFWFTIIPFGISLLLMMAHG